MIEVEVDSNGVATVTLNRPAIHNAFDDTMIAALTNAFQQAGDDGQVRALVLAAAGKSFSAGGDLNWMRRMASYSHEENLRDADMLAIMLRTLNYLPKPTIARVQGAAFGGGVGLVSCCDMAVATSRASFCLSEVKIGLIPATISPYVVRAIGERAARRYFTTAERFSATTALKLGLVSELAEHDQLDDCISGLVECLLNNGPEAITKAKQLVFDVAGREVNDTLVASTSRAIADVRGSAEGQEGLTAFLEKRKPNWIR
ncbi:MAG: enoyl-CoA hydratase/isomerase family protein [Pseudomonadales bacterium]